jgi:hypothetical protein
MSFEGTNYISDLGHEVKEPKLLAGCLTLILAAAIIPGALFGTYFLLTNFTNFYDESEIAFYDGKRKLAFTTPPGWYCFNKEGREPYFITKQFMNGQKSSATLRLATYKYVKYTPKKIRKSPGEIARQVRAALKQKEIKEALTQNGDTAGEVKKIKKAYEGFKQAKSSYNGSYGYTLYRKGSSMHAYYFKPLKKYMLVMEYKYEDSEKYRGAALKEEKKLVEMWEAGFAGAKEKEK